MSQIEILEDGSIKSVVPSGRYRSVCESCKKRRMTGACVSCDTGRFCSECARKTKDGEDTWVCNDCYDEALEYARWGVWGSSMNELHLAVALHLVTREKTALTKAMLADLMHAHIGGQELTMTRVYRREIDFMLTSGYLSSYNRLHLQVTPAGTEFLAAGGELLVRARELAQDLLPAA